MCIAGGLDGNYHGRTEILTFDGEDWKEVGNLKSARSYHAATKIDITDIMGFCD